MRQLTFIEPGKLEWRDVPTPVVEGPGEAIVEPVAVATCDLDLAIIRGQAPIPGPFALGHEFIARVVEAGPGVTSAKAGDLVVVPFQITCGECANCLRGMTSNCTGVEPKRAMYGLATVCRKEWGGALSDRVRVPFADAMLVPVPPDLDPVVIASLSDNIVDGWRTVGPHLEANPGASVLVVGGWAPSIGCYAVAVAKALGAAEVTYIDTDPVRLDLARRLGAEAVEGPPPARQGRHPITVDASGQHEGLACAIRSTEPGGVCTSIGIYYEAETPLPLLEMYTYGITFITGRPNSRPVIPSLLHLVSSGRLSPELVTTSVVSWSDAPAALLEPVNKLVMVPAKEES
ncbi:MAG: alcohol dehydrogenase catalytic domain-containing protein [Candidatus Dormiibacterota bacterium]